MSNLNLVVNKNINRKNTVVNFRFNDSLQTYSVVKMLAKYWKCDIKTAFRKYADFVVCGIC